MAEKCDEVLSLRIPHVVKNEYEALSEKDKKEAKRMMMDVLARFLWAKNHYEPDFYFRNGR